MASSKPPRMNYMKKPASSVSEEILESIYEDPDAVLGAAADGGQSQGQIEVKAKPVPLPRVKSQISRPLNNCDTANSIDKTRSTINAASSQSTRQSTDNKTPRPARPPPPRPPMNGYADSAAANMGDSYYSKTMIEAPARDLSLERRPPPLPLRPDPPPSPRPYADRTSVMSVISESGTRTAQQSRRSSVSSMSQGSVSPVLSEEALSSYSNDLQVAQATDRLSRAWVAPSRHQPPSLYRSASQNRISPTSFSPSAPPSDINSYYLREFPFYTDIVPDEPDVMTRMMSTYQSDLDYDSIYQMTTDDITRLLTWLRRVCREPDVMAPAQYGLDVREAVRSFNKRAMNVRVARRLYNLLMMKRRDSLQKYINEFQSICEKLDKVKKTNKNVGIAGGTTGAVGGVAAVVGIALAPMTMGVSLIATAVGAGMVASAGGLGAHAAKANKKTVNRPTMEKMVNDYKSDVADIEFCLQFILTVMNELRRHNIVMLQSAGAHPDAVKMADLSQVVFRNMNNSRGMSLTHPGGVTSASLLKAFAVDMDEYFTEKKNQKLKKSNKGKFACRVSILVKALQEELDYLIQLWEMLC